MDMMKMFTLLVVAMLFLAACNTMEGLGKDIQQGGAAIQKAASK